MSAMCPALRPSDSRSHFYLAAYIYRPQARMYMDIAQADWSLAVEEDAGFSDEYFAEEKVVRKRDPREVVREIM